MKHWITLMATCIALVTAFSSAFAGGATDKTYKPPTGDVTVRTAYALRAIGPGHQEVIYSLKKKIKENMEILDEGVCVEREVRKGRGAPAINFSCDKPSAKTDDFFRSLVADASTQKLVDASPQKVVDAPMLAQATSAQSVSLTTHTLALPSYCTLAYCCGVSQAESCRRNNITKPCSVCPTYF